MILPLSFLFCFFEHMLKTIFLKVLSFIPVSVMHPPPTPPQSYICHPKPPPDCQRDPFFVSFTVKQRKKERCPYLRIGYIFLPIFSILRHKHAVHGDFQCTTSVQFLSGSVLCLHSSSHWVRVRCWTWSCWLFYTRVWKRLVTTFILQWHAQGFYPPDFAVQNAINFSGFQPSTCTHVCSSIAV